MRAIIPEYNIKTPKDLNDALDILQKESGTIKPLAGGTDLMVLLNSGNLKDKNFLNIFDLKELKFFENHKDYVRIGALTTYTEIINNKTLADEYPLLREAAELTASISLQNRGTVGGNIANGSPAADTPPVLLAYDAQIELISNAGTRTVPYCDFHTGYKSSILEDNELILGIKLQKSNNRNYQYFKKVGTRKALAISKLMLAATAEYHGDKFVDVKISLGSVAPTPIRLENAETTLIGQKISNSLISRAVSQLKTDIAPIDDIRSTKKYRSAVAENLLKEFLEGIK